MYMQVYVHDPRAQDLPSLNDTNSFKRSLHRALALAMPEGWDYTSITHLSPR